MAEPEGHWIPEAVEPTALEPHEKITIQVIAALVFLGGSFLPWSSGTRSAWDYSSVGPVLFLGPAFWYAFMAWLIGRRGPSFGGDSAWSVARELLILGSAIFAFFACVGLVLTVVLGINAELVSNNGFSVGVGLVVMVIAAVVFVGALLTPTPADRRRAQPSVVELAQRELEDRDGLLAATNAKRRARGERELTVDDVETRLSDQARTDASRSSNS
ncbi:MAG: hypothetical protein J2O48_06950 [Solirubrobacterales bacterium]|nr:hypothetical protein [Solirubrobacterales bacterium]